MLNSKNIFPILCLAAFGLGLLFFIKAETKDVFSQLDPFQASLTPLLSSRIESEKKAAESFSQLQESLAEIQESLDDLSRKNADLEAKIDELTESQAVSVPDEITDVRPILQEELKMCEMASGAQPGRDKIVINEIAWMGSVNSINDEWVELKSLSGTTTNLSGWQLQDKNQEIQVILGDKDEILAYGFFLLERTDDGSAPTASADSIYSGTLSNANEDLYLFDADCRLQDIASADPDWVFGDNKTKRTLERKMDLFWQTSEDPGGTPGADNSAGYIIIPSGGSNAPVENEEPVSYPQILVSEVKIAEKTGDKDVFIELYNPNESEVELTNWYIFRNDTSFIAKSKFEGRKISSKSHFLIAKTGSAWDGLADFTFDDGTLNDDDKITLKNPAGDIVNEVSWSQIPADFSFGRKWDGANYGDFEFQTPTPKAQN